MVRDLEGYLVLALGSSVYIEMAANLAASINVMDPKRPICLVHDDSIALAPGTSDLFDDFAVLTRDPTFPGVMNKLHVFDFSPYADTMFIDADCLMVKANIDRYWAVARDNFFSITGVRRTSGAWKGLDLASLLKQEHVPYVIQMNNGVFTFNRSTQPQLFLDGMKSYYMDRRTIIDSLLLSNEKRHSAELYMGLWMAKSGLDAMRGGGRFGSDSWMVSTWRAFGIHIDPSRSISIIRKPRRSVFEVPCPILGWDKLSPTIAHFIGLKPKRLYRRLSEQFQETVRHARY